MALAPQTCPRRPIPRLLLSTTCQSPAVFQAWPKCHLCHEGVGISSPPLPSAPGPGLSVHTSPLGLALLWALCPSPVPPHQRRCHCAGGAQAEASLVVGRGCCLFWLLPSRLGYTGPGRPCPQGYSANHLSPLSLGLVSGCVEGGPATYRSAHPPSLPRPPRVGRGLRWDWVPSSDAPVFPAHQLPPEESGGWRTAAYLAPSPSCQKMHQSPALIPSYS